MAGKKRIQLDEVNEGVDLVKNATAKKEVVTKKRGGQTKDDAEKMNVIINVRFTESERDKVAKNAKKQGLTMTAFIKSSIALNGGFE